MFRRIMQFKIIVVENGEEPENEKNKEKLIK
jgi:hypothetical protein